MLLVRNSPLFSPKIIFHKNGFVDRVDQSDGNRLNYTYDSSNRLTRVTHTSGRSIVLAWTSSTPGAVTTITAPNGAVYRYDYYYTGTNYVFGLHAPILRRVSFPDNKGNIEYVQEEGTSTATGTPKPYVHVNKLLQIKVNGEAFTNYTYSVSEKVISSSFADGSSVTKYAYFNGRTESTNPYGKKRISRDPCGRVLHEASVAGSLAGWNNSSHKPWV